MHRLVKIFIAQSIDGLIAGPNDDLSFLEFANVPPDEKGVIEDYGYAKFMADVDTILMGRKTYEVVCGLTEVYPHLSRQTYVFSRTLKGQDQAGKVLFTGQDPASLVRQLQKTSGGTIAVEGGGEIIRELMAKNLVDEIILSIIPAFVGMGTPLFLPVQSDLQKARLEAVKTFPSGLVQLKYQCHFEEP